MKELALKITVDFIGTIFGIIGAIIVSFNLGINSIGYVFFWLSSLLYIIYANKTNQKNLLYLNIVFLIINTVGIIQYLR